MQYKVEPIGAEFSNKEITKLGQHFTNQAESGFKLHSVFQAQQPGCLGIGRPAITYFAIYIKE